MYAIVTLLDIPFDTALDYPTTVYKFNSIHLIYYLSVHLVTRSLRSQ